MNLNPPEMPIASRNEDPIAVVQMQNGGRRHDRMNFFRSALKGGSDKHADLENAGIGNLNAHFGGAHAWIEQSMRTSRKPKYLFNDVARPFAYPLLQPR